MINKNLIIVGAGAYGIVALELAEEMKCFSEIDFVDDFKKTSANGKKVIGTTNSLNELSSKYGNIAVAIGNPEIRASLIKKIEEETSFNIISLISDKAYVSHSAKIEKGCIIEPMAVVHTGCVISKACIISVGAVVNHFSKCCPFVHVDCNAVIEGESIVPEKTKITSCTVYKG